MRLSIPSCNITSLDPGEHTIDTCLPYVRISGTTTFRYMFVKVLDSLGAALCKIQTGNTVAGFTLDTRGGFFDINIPLTETVRTVWLYELKTRQPGPLDTHVYKLSVTNDLDIDTPKVEILTCMEHPCVEITGDGNATLEVFVTPVLDSSSPQYPSRVASHDLILSLNESFRVPIDEISGPCILMVRLKDQFGNTIEDSITLEESEFLGPKETEPIAIESEYVQRAVNHLPTWALGRRRDITYDRNSPRHTHKSPDRKWLGEPTDELDEPSGARRLSYGMLTPLSRRLTDLEDMKDNLFIGSYTNRRPVVLRKFTIPEDMLSVVESKKPKQVGGSPESIPDISLSGSGEWDSTNGSITLGSGGVLSLTDTVYGLYLEAVQGGSPLSVSIGETTLTIANDTITYKIARGITTYPGGVESGDPIHLSITQNLITLNGIRIPEPSNSRSPGYLKVSGGGAVINYIKLSYTESADGQYSQLRIADENGKLEILESIDEVLNSEPKTVVIAPSNYGENQIGLAKEPASLDTDGNQVFLEWETAGEFVELRFDHDILYRVRFGKDRVALAVGLISNSYLYIYGTDSEDKPILSIFERRLPSPLIPGLGLPRTGDVDLSSILHGEANTFFEREDTVVELSYVEP